MPRHPQDAGASRLLLFGFVLRFLARPAILRRFRFQLEGFTLRVSGSRGGSRRFLLRGTAVRIKRRQRFALDEQINIVAGDGFAVKQGLGKRVQEIDVFLQQLVAVLARGLHQLLDLGVHDAGGVFAVVARMTNRGQ